ncbi:MAG: xanthine dehydrogenase molybdopterin binding subunit [Verrucomicrobia bacterium]|nr:xanthine dehydrogenase molybdopterin binding subunit [Verrucomicrobiota bacterium]
MGEAEPRTPAKDAAERVPITDAPASPDPSAGFVLRINGTSYPVAGLPPTTTLLEFLRTHGLTGTKRGCDEGDCGACTVAVLEPGAEGRPAYRAINSCLAFLPTLAGRDIVTVEGLAGGEHLHPVQAAMVDHYGSQCGYCTPGVVMSIFAASRESRSPSLPEWSDHLCGNLCRCTGYRPIRDAALAASVGGPGGRGETASAVDSCGAGSPRLQQSASGPATATPGIGADFTYRAPASPGKGECLFLRPASLSSLFAALAAHPAARFVAGATELAVEANKRARAFPVLISTTEIPELTRLTATPEGWEIGGAVTLAEIEAVAGPEFPALAKMLRVFASRQIRHRATLGGNLATASPIGDAAPVLLCLDASLRLASATGERTVPLADFFLSYRKTALRSGEILRAVLIPRTPPAPGLTRRTDFFKVSKRRELDISIVSAAFLLDVDTAGVVRHARIAYGGVADRPRRATEAERLLIGRTLASASPEVARALASTFQPIDDVRGSATYRRGLVVSLWEKFVAGEASEAMDHPIAFVPGSQTPATDPSRSVRHESGIGHVTGRALYADDLAQRRPMLDAWPVLSTQAHARLLRRDATRARQKPGVVAVLFAEDIPGRNNVGPVRHDEPLLAAEEVHYHGQVIAWVIGESVAICRAAAALVEIEYEPLPPVLGLAAAIAAESWLTEPSRLHRADCTAALAAAPGRFDGEFSLGGQEHFYLETQAAWAEPTDDGGVLVCSSTQHPSEIQGIVGEVLGLPRHRVVTQSPRMGGGFGGKETQGNAFAAAVALAAVRTGRPVRLQLDRDLDMTITGKRHPFLARFSVGHDTEGRLLALRVALVSDGGCALDLSQAIMDRALFHLDNAYHVPAVEFIGRVARTNTASNTAFRGFGGPQGMLVMEEIIDRVARRVGLPPEQVRERNLYHGRGDTNTTHYGQEIGDNHLQRCWQLALHQAEFAQRRREVASFNQAHARIKRGLAITPVKFGISFTFAPYNQGGALVHLYQDGTAQVNHGGTEMGQGLHTKILGVAMRELGLPADRIRLMLTSTDKVPNTSATAASAGADLDGAAVAAACATLRERLTPVAVRMLAGDEADPPTPPMALVFADGFVSCARQPERRVSMADLCRRAYLDRISLSATGYYRTPGLTWDRETARGRRFHYFVTGAAVAEVEIDGYSGLHRVRRVDVVEDVGTSLNPAIDRGQIEGGFVQGMGWLTREELRWDPHGRLLTHSASTYQIPACGDAPADFRVTLLPDAAAPDVIHGSKAVGEPPFMLAISVREALRDAVAAFGPGATGVGPEVSLPSPATGEALFAAIAARIGRQLG